MSSSQGPRFVISVDYGTTYTGVAWVLTTAAPPRLQDVKVVRTWSGGLGPKVPSKLTYSRNGGERFGYNIGTDAYVLQWTKLELEPPSRPKALQNLIHSLEETRLLAFNLDNVLVDQIPRHLIKTATDIVTDYLVEVAIWVRRDIESEKEANTLRDFPIDLVITHPATWHSRAKNLTFRAVNAAFRHVFHEMNDTPGIARLATEPEACAQYTMRVAQDQGMATSGLRKGECFVVVDAGGGTVDLVSYKVEELSPNFRVSKATSVSGGPYGATLVDRYFIERFLPQRLSPEDYSSLMNLGGGEERHGGGSHKVFASGEQIMLTRFENLKHGFAGQPGPNGTGKNFIDLPEGIGLQDAPERGISNGQLCVTWRDLEDMFRDSVEGTLRLITEQLVQIDLQRLRVRTVFLSGGFSRNEYLFKRITELTRGWRFNLLRGDEQDEGSWTAVIKGAALMGLGVGCEMPPPCVECPYHIGVVVSKPFNQYDHDQAQLYTDTFDSRPLAKDTIQWMVARGDLITRDEAIVENTKLIKKIRRNGNKAGSVIIVASDFDGPSENATAASRQEIFLDYDLRVMPTQQAHAMFQAVDDPQTRVSYYRVELEVEISVSQSGARFDLICGRTVNMMGGVGAPGHLLVSKMMDFPDTMHRA